MTQMNRVEVEVEVENVVVIWGWFINSLVREEYASRASAWSRVKELMALRGERWGGSVALLEVYTVDGKWRKRAKFRRYIPGSSHCKWGDWGVEHSLSNIDRRSGM